MDTTVFTSLVDQAVAANRQCRAEFGKDYANGMHPAHYAAEFCTVRLNVGRAVGKSTYIAEHAEPWDLIIAYNEPAARHIERMLSVRPACPVLNANMLTDRSRISGRRFEPARIIWIDEASRLDGLQLDRIYHLLAVHPAQTFVLLG